MMNKQDLEQIKERNITEEQVNQQVAQLKRGTAYVQLVRAATIGDGIIRMTDDQVKQMTDAFEEDREYYQFTKFVPASGAASRMFKDLFAFMDSGVDIKFTDIFFAHIHCFAFSSDLEKTCQRLYGTSIDALVNDNRKVDVVKALLTDDGLSYGKLPKALLKFHHYDGFDRLALEEHLVEAARYAASNDGVARLHFTVSPEHEFLFTETVRNLKFAYEAKYGVRYEISYSCQKPSTDTVAIDDEGNLFREKDGKLLFRPGGHGALIENLNDLGQEIVFIKNIDNIVPETRMETTVTYKKALAGMLLRLQQLTFEYLEMLDEGGLTEDDLKEIMSFAKEQLHLDIPDFVNAYEPMEKIDFLYDRLNRPMRICGMVKNEGEPGGGPFWVRNNNDEVSLQIIESSQINHGKEDQEAIFKGATHFNPVDLVCGCWNYKGEAFNLTDYVDPSTGFVSSKSKDGRELKALELPGLWNGAMADWITLFVEVPIETFNPVKTVNDLLKPMHN
ncbi:MAG: DUF4301 family protein [Bacteroidales bacterium]|nr:DUF4301 family protein [Bacteroidales bacterium]MBR4146767.1 DUF4301 family protein [Bacteroidales bacterium]